MGQGREGEKGWKREGEEEKWGKTESGREEIERLRDVCVPVFLRAQGV